MRTFIDGNGNDSTAAVRAHLTSHRQLFCADLFQIKTAMQGAPWSKDLLFTTADQPLTWSHMGTFVPARLTRGEIESAIGFEAGTLNIDWYLRPTDLMYGTLTMLQAFERGLWDNAMVRIFRLVMPARGDGDTFGACEMFMGRIADHSFTRLGVTLKVNSLMELLDLKVPTNLVEPGNPQAEYSPGQPPAGLSNPPAFAVAAGSTPSVLLAGCTEPAGRIFADGTFDFGYVTFTDGANQGILRTIRHSDSAYGHNRLYLYEPLPFSPASGDAFLAYVPYARNASAGTGSYQGFPYVPAPETSM